ncbi:serine/threonine protein kinase [Frateuria aurantia]
MSQAPYARLTPDLVLDAVAACGLEPDGRLLALNSYENRVWQVGLEDRSFVVAKFYRPGRWSTAALEEEHRFSHQLADAELPVISPLDFGGGSLLQMAGFHYAIAPRRGGRAPSLESSHELEWMGRLIARIHAVGARESFQHRGRIDIQHLVTRPGHAVLASTLLPVHLREAYAQSLGNLQRALETCLESIGPYRELRLHGDCHPGNVLWTDDGPHFVDFDDCRMGPAIQDLWMLAADSTALQHLLDGYAQFAELPSHELALIPALQAMRQVHHAGWIAERWADPAFPAAFGFVREARWWEQHIQDLHELAGQL